MTEIEHNMNSGLFLPHQGRSSEMTIKEAKQGDFWQEEQNVVRSDSLIHAITEGKLHKVRHLLIHGASLNDKNVQGLSPLVAALHVEDAHKRSRMFVMLLNNGASYTVRDGRFLRQVMHWACALGRTEQVSSLLEETAGDIDLSQRDKDGLTALHHAVLAGSLPTVNVLVRFHARFGIPVDMPDKLGLTPYIYARRFGYKEIAQVLRQKGLACEEHADSLFRSPREWSTIGRTERERALNYQIQNQRKTAQIMGKCNFTKKVGSPIHVRGLNNSFPSDTAAQNDVLQKRNSLKYIACFDKTFPVNSTVQSQSTEGQVLHSSVELITQKTKPISSLTVDIFEGNQNTNSKSGTTVSSRSNQLSSESIRRMEVQTIPQASLTFPTNNNHQHQKLPFLNQHNHATNSNNDKSDELVSWSRQLMVSPNKSSPHVDALTLIEQIFPKGRVVSEFHNSVFDRSKMAEYKYMLGNLNSLMAVLSEQNTTSFRKSVRVQKPATPSVLLENKHQSKISTFAILFGEKKETRRRKPRPLRGYLAKKIDGKESGCKRDKFSSKTHSEKKRRDCTEIF